MSGIGEIAQMATHGVLRRIELEGQFRREDTALGSEALKNEPFAFLG
jgi:hypothetical protein